MNGSQIFREANFYAKALEEESEQDLVLDYPISGETLYIQIDGSMLLTRENSWSEVKLGRLFSSKDCVQAEGNKAGIIRKSHYVSHLMLL